MSFKVGSRSKRDSAKVVHVPVVRNLDPFIALQDVAGQFEVTFISGCSIKLDKCELDFGMAREDRFLVQPRTKVWKQVTIDKTEPGVQQNAIACGAVVSDCALQHVANVVKFMTPSLNIGRHAVLCAISLVKSVEVAVGFLYRHNLFDDFLRKLTQFGAIARLKREAHRFGPLVHIRIRKYGPMLRGVALPL